MKVNPEEIHKELDLIQAIISRMAANSFEVKKWLIGIISAIIVFKTDELMGGHKQMVWVLLFPVLCFWYLDAFFLSTEKLYREMYKWVVKNRPVTDKYLYDLNTMSREYPNGNVEKLNKPEHSVLNMAVSKTLWPFYLIPVLFIVGYGIVGLLGCGCAGK